MQYIKTAKMLHKKYIYQKQRQSTTTVVYNISCKWYGRCRIFNFAQLTYHGRVGGLTCKITCFKYISWRWHLKWSINFHLKNWYLKQLTQLTYKGSNYQIYLLKMTTLVVQNLYLIIRVDTKFRTKNGVRISRNFYFISWNLLILFSKILQNKSDNYCEISWN
jgi:hypothetical protein